MKKNSLVFTWLLFSCSLLSAQNVGIGTTKPTALLHTIGTVRHEQLPTGNGNFVVIDSLGNLYKSDLSALPILSRTQILAKYTWEIDETYAVISGSTKHYKKGVENNTGANYGVTRYTFNVDGTGTYIDALGVTYQSTWRYITVDQNNIEFSYATLTYHWAMVSISEAEFTVATPLTNSIVVARLTPVQ